MTGDVWAVRLLSWRRYVLGACWLKLFLSRRTGNRERDSGWEYGGREDATKRMLRWSCSWVGVLINALVAGHSWLWKFMLWNNLNTMDFVFLFELTIDLSVGNISLLTYQTHKSTLTKILSINFVIWSLFACYFLLHITPSSITVRKYGFGFRGSHY